MPLVTGRPWLPKRNMIYDLYPKMFVLGQRVFPQRLSGPDPSNRCDLVHWSASNCCGTLGTQTGSCKKILLSVISCSKYSRIKISRIRDRRLLSRRTDCTRICLFFYQLLNTFYIIILSSFVVLNSTDSR